MRSPILDLVSGAVAALVMAILTEFVQRIVRRRRRRGTTEKTYSERLAELTENLTRASREVDAVLTEFAGVAKERSRAVQQLETDLMAMSGRERELKERIEVLEKTPLPVAEHFARLVAPGERRSAVRDYMLFGAGVVVSTLIGIAIQVFGN